MAHQARVAASTSPSPHLLHATFRLTFLRLLQLQRAWRSHSSRIAIHLRCRILVVHGMHANLLYRLSMFLESPTLLAARWLVARQLVGLSACWLVRSLLVNLLARRLVGSSARWLVRSLLVGLLARWQLWLGGSLLVAH